MSCQIIKCIYVGLNLKVGESRVLEYLKSIQKSTLFSRFQSLWNIDLLPCLRRIPKNQFAIAHSFHASVDSIFSLSFSLSTLISSIRLSQAINQRSLLATNFIRFRGAKKNGMQDDVQKRVNRKQKREREKNVYVLLMW